jgi:polyhydroxyalkanoate synthesis repressor PhaR
MAESQNSETILIKKYANRRLYNVTHSKHLTLDEMIALIRDGNEVQVIDSKSKKDITQSVLTQVFLEQNTYLFSSEFLHRLIQTQNDLMGEFFTEYVPKFLESYLQTRDMMRRQVHALASPQSWMQPPGMQKLMNPFASFAEQLERFRPGAIAEVPLEAAESETQQMETLKARIRELEREVEDLKA